ncbi:hypothetical protein [Mucilaginibacter psychrotolerans]|uniref:DUF3990 domain-containing protein n=1 Tax=Mucilaginibacter psychrotolerans TaxID=1524096 RepID=A0A4Y8S465_9SPHI|nr:hypothetical protein [Mucilaginibacter psychrotolerans]TFF33360.1 hypothetical protein E2R66_26235 [Mucilaginibacter psychrotolerans]
MYDIRPNFIIGFHGCDISVANNLVNNPDHIKISTEKFDWLGHGMYFWENNYVRAMQWAEEKKARGKIATPAVVGAVIQLGQCCDFLDSKFIRMIQSYHPIMELEYKAAGRNLPENLDHAKDPNKDKLQRILDCTAIEFMHSKIATQIAEDISNKGYSNFHNFDSTRGVFTEGGPAFPGAGILEKSHIQICVRNINCIKGFFKLRKEIEFKP